MGEKADLRAQLRAVRGGHTETMNKLRRAEDEVRRLRSVVAALTDRLEDTLTRLRDQRAFTNGVADLARLVTRLTNVPNTEAFPAHPHCKCVPILPPTGADQQEGTTTT
jgi:septal ring factor EnvC (AmiA/AmiB activator)